MSDNPPPNDKVLEALGDLAKQVDSAMMMTVITQYMMMQAIDEIATRGGERQALLNAIFERMETFKDVIIGQVDFNLLDASEASAAVHVAVQRMRELLKVPKADARPLS